MKELIFALIFLVGLRYLAQKTNLGKPRDLLGVQSSKKNRDLLGAFEQKDAPDILGIRSGTASSRTASSRAASSRAASSRAASSRTRASQSGGASQSYPVRGGTESAYRSPGYGGRYADDDDDEGYGGYGRAARPGTPSAGQPPALSPSPTSARDRLASLFEEDI